MKKKLHKSTRTNQCFYLQVKGGIIGGVGGLIQAKGAIIAAAGSGLQDLGKKIAGDGNGGNGGKVACSLQHDRYGKLQDYLMVQEACKPIYIILCFRWW